MLRQYVEAKEENPDVILLFRMGDFFELFFDDAKLAAELLDLTLTARDKGDNPVPMAGVPHHAVEGYIARLVAQGHSVALCDQVEDPKAQKGLVKRAITRLVTPGTICELDALDPGRASYLAAAVAVAEDAAAWRPDNETAAEADAERPTRRLALCFLDVLAGELALTLVTESEASEELVRMGAREVLVAPESQAALASPLRQAGVVLRPDWQARQPAGGPLPACPPLPVRIGERKLEAVERAALARAVQETLAWARHTQRQELGHLGTPRIYQLAEALAMDGATRQNLELVCTQMGNQRKGSLLGHLDCTHTPMGSRLLRRWLLAPLRNLATIGRRADVVEALVGATQIRSAVRTALRDVRDVERLAGRVAVGRATPRDLLALATSLLQLPEVATQAAALPRPLAAPLADAWLRAPDLQALARATAAGLVEQPPSQAGEGGIFARGYDAELDALLTLTDDADAWLRDFEEKERARTGIAGLKVRYNRVFGYNLEISRAQTKAVPADYVRRQTLANAERYVTATLKTFEEKALTATAERKAREAHLFAELLARYAEQLPALKGLARLLGQTDSLAALAEVAARHRYVRPALQAAPILRLTGSRHPVLETLLPQGERFVPNDLACAADDGRLMVLTGPNMAGKSTLMRQAALSVVMAQMGGFVPAERAEVGVCDRLFVRVGASDNLSRGQSTFMVEMVETATILRQASRQSLVLLDEIGRGTSTFDGLSIAWAVAEHLHDAIGCRTLFATHYHELVALTSRLERAVAMQVTVHEQDGALVFLRQLKPGAAMRSYGIEVARLAEVPLPVLQRARQVLAALEASSGNTADTGVPAAAGAQDTLAGVPRRGQLTLALQKQPVAPAPARPPLSPATKRARRLARALAKLDVNHLTPVQALVALQHLRQLADATDDKVEQHQPARAAAARPQGQKSGRARMHQAQLLP